MKKLTRDELKSVIGGYVTYHCTCFSQGGAASGTITGFYIGQMNIYACPTGTATQTCIPMSFGPQ